MQALADAMRLSAIILAGVLSVLTPLLIAGQGPWAGRVVLRVGDGHGLHAGDVLVLLLYLAGIVCCWTVWRRAN